MEDKILEVFLYKHKLKFSEIQKTTKLRSNKLSYYLDKLKKKGILVKENDSYKISEASETLIPYITNKRATLPVILVAIEKQGKIFLYERRKRPYHTKLSLPGGRITIGESFSEATKRVMKEKLNIKAKLIKINSVSLEHVKKNGKIVHSFLLIFISATAKDKIIYFDIEKNKSRIISSDYKLIKNNLDKQINIETIISRTP